MITECLILLSSWDLINRGNDGESEEEGRAVGGEKEKERQGKRGTEREGGREREH